MRKYLNSRGNIALGLIFAFLLNSFGPLPVAQAQDFALPAPGAMVSLSPAFNPPILKGIKVHPDNPFRFDFILDRGDTVIPAKAGIQQQEQLKQQSTQLIKYFLASLTIPEKDLWVNLSPYEKNRIVPESFGQTEMGRDLLAEDYMLKQITASLIYPEGEVGKRFWKRIYEEASQRFGTTNIPVNTFNKVWIVPEKAVVYENAKAGAAYVVESKLKVMLEQDYLSMQKHTHNGDCSNSAVSKMVPGSNSAVSKMVTGSNSAVSKMVTGSNSALGPVRAQELVPVTILRQIVIPELTKEVNEDKNFAQLRQVYNSLILATWYKKKIKDSILEQVYADKNKVAGVNIDDPQEKQRIYERYLQAFKKGVFNYIKDTETPEGVSVPRKYFSGGLNIDPAMVMSMANKLGNTWPLNNLMEVDSGMNLAKVGEVTKPGDVAMNALEKFKVQAEQGMPTLVDFGAHDGSFLKAYKKQHPNTAVLGFDRHKSLTASGVYKEGEPPIAIADARNTGLPDSFVDVVTINMPDPQDIFNPNYPGGPLVPGLLAEANRILKTNGIVYLITESSYHHMKILSALEDAGFEIEMPGRDLSDAVEPDYPRESHWMKTFSGQLMMFKAKKILNVPKQQQEPKDENIDAAMNAEVLPTDPESATQGAIAFYQMMLKLHKRFEGLDPKEWERFLNSHYDDWRDLAKVYTGINPEVSRVDQIWGETVFNSPLGHALIKMIEEDKNIRVVDYNNRRFSVLNLPAAQRVIDANPGIFPPNGNVEWLLNHVDEWYRGAAEFTTIRTVRYGLLSGFPPDASNKFVVFNKTMQGIESKALNSDQQDLIKAIKHRNLDKEPIRYPVERVRLINGLMKLFPNLTSQQRDVLVDGYSFQMPVRDMGFFSFKAFSQNDQEWGTVLLRIYQNALSHAYASLGREKEFVPKLNDAAMIGRKGPSRRTILKGAAAAAVFPTAGLQPVMIEAANIASASPAAAATFATKETEQLTETTGGEFKVTIEDDRILDVRYARRYFSPLQGTLSLEKEQVRNISRQLRQAENFPEALEKAATEMKPFINPNDILVPVPDSQGNTSANLILAKKIVELSGEKAGVEIRDILRKREPTESQRLHRINGEKGLTAEELGIYSTDNSVPIQRIVFIDNVAATGETLRAAYLATGGGRAVVYSKAEEIIYPKRIGDNAQLAIKAGRHEGGIDLTSDKVLSVQNNGQGIKFHLDPAQLARLQNAPGFVPVIIGIKPMVDLRNWLGLNDGHVFTTG